MPHDSPQTSRKRFSHAILDVDGTLVDNLDLIVESLNFAVAEYVGKKFTNAEAYSIFGPTLEQIITTMVSSTKVDEAIERYHAHYESHFRALARVYPGVLELLNVIRQAGVQVSVYTGSSRRMTQVTLERSGLNDAISIVVTADDVNLPKPDPEGILLAMRLTHADPVHTICLGDSVRDIEASKRAGIVSAAALWGFGDGKKLRAAAPNYVFRDPSEVIQLLT